MRLTGEAQEYMVLLVGKMISSGIRNAVYVRSTNPTRKIQAMTSLSLGERVRMWSKPLRLQSTAGHYQVLCVHCRV